MSRRSRRIALGVTGPLLFAAAVVWLAMSHSPSPHYQERAMIMGMAGMNEHLINLWLDPYPAEVGEVKLTAQVASIIGTPVGVRSIVFQLTPPDGGEPIELPASHAGADAERELSHVARAVLDRPGTWRITARFAAGGTIGAVDFLVEVAP